MKNSNKSAVSPVAKDKRVPKQETIDGPLDKSLFMDSARAKKIQATIITEKNHQIVFRDIDNNAVNIVSDLQQANHESYLVGGCVRDLLLKKKPKDFDVTTAAHPEQAHKVFKRSRLIGRRFKLLHVRFGRDLIEVATFRAAHQEDATQAQAKQAESGMILRDNVYGSIEQDALRRDFTINALYYDVNSRSIYDFTDGYQDISDQKIRMIGNPDDRYREDPVRMLRAIRFAAKLGFSIEEATAKPIKTLAPMLFDIAPARLFDEVLKLLQSGHGNDSLVLLRKYNLLETILPLTAQCLDEQLENANLLIFNALKNTDNRLKQRKSVSPGFLYAVLLWPAVQDQLNKTLATKRTPPLTALNEVASKVISEQVKRTSIPKRFSANIREIWELQLRLTRKPNFKASQLVEHPRFRAAYDLVILRENSGEDLNGIGKWWTEFQIAKEPEREQLINQFKLPKAKPRKNKTFNKSRDAAPVVFEKFNVVEQVKPTVIVTEQVPTIDTTLTSKAPKPVAERAAKPTIEPAAKPAVIKSTVTPIQAQSVSKQIIESNEISPKPVATSPERLTPAIKPAPRNRIRRNRAKNDPRNKK